MTLHDLAKIVPFYQRFGQEKDRLSEGEWGIVALREKQEKGKFERESNNRSDWQTALNLAAIVRTPFCLLGP